MRTPLYSGDIEYPKHTFILEIAAQFLCPQGVQNRGVHCISRPWLCGEGRWEHSVPVPADWYSFLKSWTYTLFLTVLHHTLAVSVYCHSFWLCLHDSCAVGGFVCASQGHRNGNSRSGHGYPTFSHVQRMCHKSLILSSRRAGGVICFNY